jgi:hypothetical protein
VRELQSVGEASELLGILQEYFAFDKKFLSRRNLAGMLKTAVNLAMNDTVVNQVPLRGITESEDPLADTRLYISNENVKKAYDAFMTGEGAQNPERTTEPIQAPKRKKGKAASVSGMVDAKRAGEDMAVLAEPRLKRLPFYFPGKITNRSRYSNDSPRIYSLRDEDGNLQRAYRLTLGVGESGEYWGVQGLTWRTPPILENPDRIRKTAGGRELMLFYDGKKIRMVAWRTPRAAYWISNTIGRKVSNARMIEIASSLRRLKQ